MTAPNRDDHQHGSHRSDHEPAAGHAEQHHADDVQHMGHQERSKPGDERQLGVHGGFGQHEEHIAGQGQDNGGQIPPAQLTAGQVEGEHDGAQRHHRRRLEYVFEGATVDGDRHPVGQRDQQRQGQQSAGNRGHRDRPNVEGVVGVTCSKQGSIVGFTQSPKDLGIRVAGSWEAQLPRASTSVNPSGRSMRIRVRITLALRL